MPEPVGRATRIVVAVLAPLLVLITLGSWAIASPVGSAPDDDYHLASIWCGIGDRAGLCETVPNSPTERDVPTGLTIPNNPVCDRYQTTMLPACSAGLEETALKATTRVNAGHTYPPVFYAALSILASKHIVVSALAMRAANALLFTLLVSLLYLALPAARRMTLVLAFAVSLVPMGLFIITSTNPSGWSVLGAGTLWLALVGYFETTGRRKIALGALAAASMLIGAGSRADTAIYCSLSVLAAGFLAARKGRGFWSARQLWLPVVLIAAAVVLFLSAHQSSVATTGVGGTITGAVGEGSKPVQYAHYGGLGLLFTNFTNLGELWAGNFGLAGLGWLHTLMPYTVPTLAVFAFGAASFWGLRRTNWRKTLTFAGVAAVLVAAPLALLQPPGLQVGDNVQPRYFLPLLVILVGVALHAVDQKPARMSLAQAVTLIVVISLANMSALYANIHHYTHAATDLTFNLNVSPAWWWPAPLPSPMATFAIGTLAFAGALVVLLFFTASGRALLRSRELAEFNALADA